MNNDNEEKFKKLLTNKNFLGFKDYKFTEFEKDCNKILDDVIDNIIPECIELNDLNEFVSWGGNGTPDYNKSYNNCRKLEELSKIIINNEITRKVNKIIGLYKINNVWIDKDDIKDL